MFALGRTAFVWGFAIIVFFEGEAFLLLTFGRADKDFKTRFLAVDLALAVDFFFAEERFEAGFTTFFAAFFLATAFAGFLACVRAPSVLLAFAGFRFEVVFPVDFLAI